MSELSTDVHVVIVGASLAGVRTAQGLRAMGHQGAITLIGAEADLPYDRPPLSKDLLKGPWSDDRVEGIRLISRSEADDQRIALRLGVAATELDAAAKRVALADGSSVAYDVLVIATGAAARPSPWHPASGVYQLRTLQDARAIADRLELGEPVVVVGGGFIGTEIAAAARAHGCDVVVVDPIPEPMARLVGDEIAASLVELHRRNGAQTRFGVGVADITGVDGDLVLALSDGTTLSASMAVVGIGSIPSTGWLADSGLAIDNGVLTDGFLRALGAEDVYAIGDVARWPHEGRGATVRAEHWTNASDQARYVADAIAAGGAERPYVPSDYVWSDQYDWKVHSVGWCDPAGRSVQVGDLDSDGRVAVIHESADGAACGAVTVNWVRALNQARRLLAAGGPASAIVDQLQQLA